MPELTNALGRYEVLREVGRGGMATVYLARQVELDRLVALKVLGALRDSDPSFRQRFLREARMAGSLSHPNIVTVHDFFEQNATPAIAMEYLRRGSLRPYAGTLTLAQVGGVLEGLLAGLAHAETHGIVHRDLKPENVLVSDDGRVKIVDFGIAKVTNDLQLGGFATSTGIALGTPNYVAPEQAMAHEIGPWTDLYSVGILTFELFVGQAPFADTPEPMAVLLRQINEQVPSLSHFRPDVDPSVSNWVDWLLEKEPSQRPQSAREAWDKLEDRLVGVLGPRWERDATLPELATAFRSDGGPQTEAPLNGSYALSAGSNGIAGATQAQTIPPRPNTWQAQSAAEPPVRRRRRPSWRAARLALLLLVPLLAWGAAQRLRDSPAAQAPVASHPGVSRTAPTPTTTASTPSPKQPGRGATSDLPKQAAGLRSTAAQYDSAAASVAAVARGDPTPERATLVAALRETALAYAQAADAAARNDRVAYLAALRDAQAGKRNVKAATQQVSQARQRGPSGGQGSSSPTAQAPSSPAQPAPAPSSGSCSGDSSSDDPSDDSCEP